MQKILLLVAALLPLPTIYAAIAPSAPAVPALPISAAPPPLPTRTVTALTAEDVNTWLDGYLPHALKTTDIAGAVVAIVKEGQILIERGFGYSDVATRAPVDPKHTLFRTGSVSKLFTWTAVMQLVEQQKIDLDADVNRYLDFQIPSREGKPVTMRNLMQHTAGFEEHGKGIISEDPRAPGFEALLKESMPERVFAPGSTPAYSNYGASLAGYIVQRVSGEPFDDYIEKHIFEPLDMRTSSFRQPLPANLAAQMSTGYTEASDPPHGFEIVGPAPAGAQSSSGEDMAHFMIAHLQNGEYHGNRILRAETAQLMHNSPLTLLPPLNRMELGFFETNINGHEVIGHLGDTQYFHTSLHLFLKDGVGLYVSFNSAGTEGAAGSLRAALFHDFADRYFPSDETVDRVDAKTTAVHAAMLKGNWDASRRWQSSFLSALELVGQTKIKVDDKGQLVAPFLGLNGKPRHWEEIGPYLWRDPNDHERLAANIVDGHAVRFSIDGASPFMVFDRVPWYQDAAWLIPTLIASLAVFLLTALMWPIAAIVRRRYGAALALDRPSLMAYRLSKIASILFLAGSSFWVLTLGRMVKNTSNLSGQFESTVLLTQIFGIVTLIAGSALILWNLRVVWSKKRRWPARLWSLVLTVSALTVLWVAIAFHLIGVGTNY